MMSWAVRLCLLTINQNNISKRMVGTCMRHTAPDLSSTKCGIQEQVYAHGLCLQAKT